VRRLFIIAALALLAGAIAVQLVQGEVGYILVAYGDYTIEATFWAGLLSLLAGGLALYILLRLLLGLLAAPRRLRDWWRVRSERRETAATERAMVQFLQGDYAGSRQRVEHTARGTRAPLLHYLVAARASNALGEPAAAKAYLERAEIAAPQELAVALLRAETLLAAGQPAGAAQVLREGPDPRRQPQALALLVRCCRQQQDWEGLLALLPDVRRRRALDQDSQRELQREAYAGLLQLAMQSGEDQAVSLRTVWRRVPGRLRRDPGLLVGYCRLLAQAGTADTAVGVLLRALRREWDPVLIRAYAQLPHVEPVRALARAERWLARHDREPELLLALARLALQAEAWPRAREFLEAALALKASPEIYAELGRLLSALGDHTAALDCYRRGLLQLAPALPPLALPPKGSATGA